MKYVKTVAEALEFIQSQHDALQKKVDVQLPSHKKLVDYPKLPDLFRYQLSSVGSNGDYVSYSPYSSNSYLTVESITKRRDNLLAICDGVPATLEATRNENLTIIEHNKSVVALVNSVMKTVGIPDTFSYKDPNSRARNPKTLTKCAGYKDDLTRNVKTVDTAYNVLIKSAEAKRNEIKKWADAALKEITDKEAQIEADKKAKSKDKLLATLKLKYDLSFDVDEEEVTDAILDKCPLLKLADAMLEARNDFSEHYRVEYALNGLDTSDTFQGNVYDEISRLCDTYEGDGRIFRDCEYNYSVLFAAVEDHLLDDYNKLKAFM